MPPAVDTYATPIGWVYDTGVNLRAAARLAGRLEWGADISVMYEWMDRGVRCGPGEVVLDVPVGGGTVIGEGAPGLEGLLIGIDLSLAMLARAQRRRAQHGLEAKVLLARGDATRLPVISQGVDRVLCFNGLHVIPDKGSALLEFRRVLKRGGELVGTTLVWDAPQPYRSIVAMERLASFFVPAQSGALQRLAHRVGFRRWEQQQDGALLYFRGE
jgi:ubiquinone/menaquinone biosynthesis C-methylase UbiE